ncbi:response regulator [Fulvivirgaceae bacterium BMA12]|uniref:histidine kinase n=1 Tax=Agaribacillus aureus TaxID=3051825 RepID=A0ABT8L1U9_9BACT|nr:response regulator [Fulvivirgaceae bacterium BMA12]
MKVNSRILLIEDDPIDQMAFERFVKMEELNFEYDIADSVQQASEKLSANEYDVIITDYMLGDGNAFDILNLGHRIPLIFTSGVGDEEIIVKAMKKGASDYLIKDTSRNYLKVLPLTIDKTIRRSLAEKRLLAVEEELKQLSIVASQTSNAVIIFDSELKIEWVNEAFCKMTGYSFLETKGSSGEILRKDTKNIFKINAVVEQVIKGKKSYTYENLNLTKDGEEYWALTTLTPIIDVSGDIHKIIAIESDITANKKVEQELIVAKEKAEESTRIKEEFLANMSHEIRTPLNGIKGFTDLLVKNEHYPEQEKYLEAIQFSTKNLLIIINDILDFSKIEAGKMELEQTEFYFRDLIESIFNSFIFQVKEKGLEISKKIEEKIPETLVGDPVRINQVITNLMSNALKFTEKGSIELIVEEISRKGDDINLQFKVKDSGIGIPEDKLDYIFTSFSQASSSTTRKYGGTGLGLAIVKNIVNLFKGQIRVESTEGIGSVFIFDLHLEIAKNQNILKEIEKPDQKIDISGIKILVAEDYPMNQLLINETLSSWDVETEIVENGKLAFEKVQENEYDLILMDVNMPEMGGLEASRLIRDQLNEPQKSIPIIAMTAGALKGDKEKCIEAGMNDYVSKPFDQDELFLKIANFFSLRKKELAKMNQEN